VFSRLIFKGLLLTLVGVAGCQPQITPIVKLNRQAQVNSVVYVQGTVRDRAPLLNQTAYQLQDETGKIWVITSHSAPESGQTVMIQAKIKSKLIVLHQQGAQELYLQEVQQFPSSLK